ncbi:filamentous hemagglutinin N-terminal domain-containing protein [Crocosphaera chwakensis]|uniref:Filamentous haemagglutinin-like protein n=1 Tax=Crocosphaera chwakensis CCY0110 TaxID=391612 RepID=A3ILA2_9CHRO|nr:S-layer family protein [Crocosphaera chwakensis]EAZ92971.1 Filamentous haemagglutinin-like protein [Crocosphaera chwakensis CCY0110]
MKSVLLRFILTLFLSLVTSCVVTAQIVHDKTLPRNSVVDIEGKTKRITGGTIAQTNLFHSFSEFSVSTGNTAFFDNILTINNIIIRVTGGQISSINGLIKANGNANLFLLNPNGIIFGANAKLDLGGSFVATTAESYLFENGSFFSATDPQATALLTVSIPVGLRFGETPGTIINRSQATQRKEDGVETIVGLQVQPGRTLALIGGEVRLEGGQLSSAAGTIDLSQVGATLVGRDGLKQNVQTVGGRIELGAVGPHNQVKIFQSPENTQILNLSYEGVDNFQDIQLSQLAIVDASGDGGGAIQVQGRRVIMNEGSLIRSNTLGANLGRPIIIRATESLEVLGNTLTDDLSDPRFAAAGLIVPRLTSISTSSFSSGQAGDIIIQTGKALINLGAEISAFSFGSGIGGNVLIRASESVEIFGQAIPVDFEPKFFLSFGFDVPGFDDASFRSIAIGSRISASSVGEGNAGSVRIETRKLSVLNGAEVTTDSLFIGNGGSITVTASESIEVSGTSKFDIPPNLSISPSLISAAATGTGDAKDVTLNTKKLIVRDGGIIQAATFSTGDGGNIFINASESVEVSGARFLRSNSPLSSSLRASSFGSGNAGNLIITTNQLVVREGANISVEAVEQGIEQAGNLTINANSLYLNQGTISAETATSQTKESANIILNISDLLIMENESLISATANGSADGGNIDIDTSFLLVFPPIGANGNDIIAKAEQGNGGRIDINAQGIFGIEENLATPGNRSNDLDASSEAGASGEILLNRELDPNRGLVRLPENVIDPNTLIAQNVCKQGSESEFVVTGRGGLPPSPTSELNSEATQIELVQPAPISTMMPDNGEIPQDNEASTSEQKSIIPAQGWVFNEKGEIVLVSYNPSGSELQRLPENDEKCSS